MVGDEVQGCRVRWHEAVGRQGMARTLDAIAVRHVSPGTVEWTRPRSGEVVRKRLSGSKLEVLGPDGTDLVARWRGPACEAAPTPQPLPTPAPLAFTAWDTEDDIELEEAGGANWRCHAGDAWTLDVWPDDNPGRWAWDVTWTGEYDGDEHPYQMGHADSEDGAQLAAESACVDMEAQRLEAVRAGEPWPM